MKSFRLTYQFSTIRFPGGNLILAGHGEMDGVHHHAVTRCRRWRRDAIRGIE